MRLGHRIESAVKSLKGASDMRTRYPIKYGLFLMAYYVTNAIYQGYMPVYFQDLGLDTRQIGILVSAVPLVSIFAQPMWGAVGDRMNSRNRLLRILAVGAALSVLAMLFTRQMIGLLPLVCLFSCFFTSIQPLGDSVVLEALQEGNHPFGPARLAGCLSFAVANIAFGALFGANVGLVIYLTAAMLMMVLLSTYALPVIPGHQSQGGRKMSMGVLFKQKKLMRLLLFMMPLQATMGFFYAFFSVHFVALPGGSSSLLGWAYFLSAVSETPFLLMSDKLYEKMGAGKLMCVAGCALTLRWVILALSGNVWLTLASQVLHGWGFIVMTVSMAKHINQYVPDELKASGQMLLAMVGYGFARVAGTLGGGFLADGMGIQPSFWLCAAITAISLLIFAPGYLKKRPNLAQN
jgi:PPP family 3-phenylpropionic acid transporter